MSDSALLPSHLLSITREHYVGAEQPLSEIRPDTKHLLMKVRPMLGKQALRRDQPRGQDVVSGE